MLGSIAVNYLIGLALAQQHSSGIRKLLITCGVSINLCLLLFFKYTNWIIEILSPHLPVINTLPFITSSHPIHLPIGISFFTFQAISYIVDVYRDKCQTQRNPLHLGLYISSFPQLIAGPIIRYHDVAQQLIGRIHSFSLFAAGVQRFIFGLSKKVLIANPLGEVADIIFALDHQLLSPGIAWLGILSYTLQIYFDFSGYSDMAIGLGKMFGFRFLENFNYPYISRSISEFWKRWHISLSGWFKDYLYIPLGGNRKGLGRTYCNLMLVFLLCGLWHGASWNFIIWGLIHGGFLILEKFLKPFNWTKLPFTGHCYTMLVVIHGWVFFRADTLDSARHFLQAMYGLNNTIRMDPILYTRIDTIYWTAAIAGIIFATPVTVRVQQLLSEKVQWADRWYVTTAKTITLFVMLLASFSSLAVSSYNPFIYFRF